MNTTNNEQENIEQQDELNVDVESAVNESETDSSTETAVKSELEIALEQLADYKDKYLRLYAEFDNYRKHAMKEKSELIRNGGEKVISAILPIIDDFERAHDNMDRMEDVAAVKEGVELIIDKFLTILKKEGLEPIETDGEAFNVDFHEAIAMVPAPNDELKGKVLDCVQKGYKLNDKVIRYAKVAVGQ